MVHVRGVMQHTTKRDFLVKTVTIINAITYIIHKKEHKVAPSFQVQSRPTEQGRLQSRGVINYPASQSQTDIFEISYKNHKTGKIRRWNLMDSPFQEFPNGSVSQSSDVDNSEVKIRI